MSKRFRKLSHTLYESKFHIVSCPKYRYRIFRDEIAEYTQQQIYILCRQKDLVEILELNIREDHIHQVMWIPPQIFRVFSYGFFKKESGL
jgi:putative transposase